MVKGIIFDLDGTLADTMPDLLTAMNAMLRHFGWRERTREELLRFINRGVRPFVSCSMPEGSFVTVDDPIVDEAIKVYNDEYAKCYNDKTAPFPGVAELLSELKSRGVRLGVLSNKQDEFVKLIIEKLFPGIFDSVNGHLLYPEKPSPESSLAAAREMGVEPCDCAFVGDSDVDMKTGVNAGMIPVGVTWGYRSAEVLTAAGARAVADDTESLLRVLGEIC